MADEHAMDPDPARSPDLEPGGGVAPGATPPDIPQTSGLSAPEPATADRFPPSGIAAVVVAIGLIVLVLVGLVLMILE